MVTLPRLNSRYEIRDVLGQGGMGIVYKAYDSVIRREVALKTLRDAPDPAALETFQKECGVLASMAHPNTVEIFDLGEFEENGTHKPYFGMPLLPGMTLEALIRMASQRLTVERVVEIITQTCRGLQAAHERGLIHRDLKPINIFVLDDDSVKIIDFGVAHICDSRTTMGLKGTLAYMSPEQIEMKPLSPLSDLFSLAVVGYETLALRRPFQGKTQSEIVEAILHQIPPPVSEFNPAVNSLISRVIHKALAKQPFHRFASAREFAEIVQKALRNERLEIFDPSRIQPRVQRAARAFEQEDYQFAAAILGELLAEGLPIRFRKASERWIWYGVALLLVVMLGGIWAHRRRPPSTASQPTLPNPAPSHPIRLDVLTTPPGARIFINDRVRGTADLVLELLPGSHQIRAEVEGYVPTTTPLEPKPDSALPPMEIVLQPASGASTSSTQSPSESGAQQTQGSSASLAKRRKALETRAPVSSLAVESAPLPGTLRGYLQLKRSPASSQVVLEGGENRNPACSLKTAWN